MPEEKLHLYYYEKIEYDIDSNLRKKTKRFEGHGEGHGRTGDSL